VVVEVIRQHSGYDLVIFDTPSTLLCADDAGEPRSAGLGAARAAGYGVNVVRVLPNQSVAMASGANGYESAPSSGYADAPEQHNESCIAHAEATSDGQEGRLSRILKTSRKQLRF